MQKYQIITWLVYHIPFKITKKMIFSKRSVMIKKMMCFYTKINLSGDKRKRGKGL